MNAADMIVAKMAEEFNKSGTLTAEWVRQAHELDRLALYGTGSPTWRGLFDLVAMINSLAACQPRSESGALLVRASPIHSITSSTAAAMAYEHFVTDSPPTEAKP